MELITSVVPIQTTSNDRRYVEFECVRYVYIPVLNDFQPFDWSLGPRNADIHIHGRGLSPGEAAVRLELNGPNEISFKPDTFFEGLLKEYFFPIRLALILLDSAGSFMSIS